MGSAAGPQASALHEHGGEDLVGVTRQSEGHPDVVLRETPLGEIVAKVPNGERVAILATEDESLKVKWKDLVGWAKRGNVMTHRSFGDTLSAHPLSLTYMGDDRCPRSPALWEHEEAHIAECTDVAAWEFQSDDDRWYPYDKDTNAWIELCWEHALEHCTVMLVNGEHRMFFKINFATLIQKSFSIDLAHSVRRQGRLLPTASLGEWWPHWAVEAEERAWVPYGRALSGQIEVAVLHGRQTCAVSVLVGGRPIPYVIDLARSVQINPQTHHECAVRRVSLDEEIDALPTYETARADLVLWTQEGASSGLQRSREDYHSRGSDGKLGILLQEGAVALPKCDYFADRYQQGLCMQRRQDVAAKYFWDPQSFLKLWSDTTKCRFIAVSYSWIARGNPDPERYHLQRLAVLLAAFIYSPGVFLDFISLYQLPRSAEEQRLFKKALATMDVIYGHSFIGVIIFRDLPASVELRAEERGWPFFEKCVACLSGKSPANKILEFDECFDPAKKLDFNNSDFSDRMTNGLDESKHGAKQNPPCNPRDFTLLLQSRGFTNGHTEREVVCAMYKTVFTCFFATKSQKCSRHTISCLGSGIDHEWIRGFLRCWPYMACTIPVKLNLNCNPAIGDKGAVRLIQALQARPFLATCSVDCDNGCNISNENLALIKACKK